MTDLAELERRLKAATGPDRELDKFIGLEVVGFDPGQLPTVFPDIGEPPGWPAYTASLDAALALVEKKLPGWMTEIHTADGSAETHPIVWHIEKWDVDEYFATLAYEHPGIEAREIGVACENTPAFAVLIALIRALREMEGSDA